MSSSVDGSDSTRTAKLVKSKEQIAFLKGKLEAQVEQLVELRARYDQVAREKHILAAQNVTYKSANEELRQGNLFLKGVVNALTNRALEKDCPGNRVKLAEYQMVDQKMSDFKEKDGFVQAQAMVEHGTSIAAETCVPSASTKGLGPALDNGTESSSSLEAEVRNSSFLITRTMSLSVSWLVTSASVFSALFILSIVAAVVMSAGQSLMEVLQRYP